MVTAILTKQGKKKKTMSGLKYPNKKWMKKGSICETTTVFILIYDLWII